MDTTLLKEAAKHLRERLDFYKLTDRAAVALYADLEPLLSAAEQGLIKDKLEPRDIPGYRLIVDTSLQQYDDLSKAYSKFYLELTDGRSPNAYQIIKDMLENSPKADDSFS